MKRLSFTLSFCLAVIHLHAGNLIELRNMFYQSTENGTAAEHFFNQLQEVNEDSSAIKIGFKGMSYLLQAKHVMNPFTKFSYFNEGTGLIDASIAKDSTNIELRFFRLSVQENAPRFLGYYEEIETDKTMIQNKLPEEQDLDLKNKITNYLNRKTTNNDG